MKALLRDVNTESTTEVSAAQISKRESSMLKSGSKATEFCNLLSTYCLLDVIVHLEATKSSLLPPLHKKLEIDLPKNEVHAFLYISILTMTRKCCEHLRIGL